MTLISLKMSQKWIVVLNVKHKITKSIKEKN